MALTTYTKTAWANGTSPAINATNLGKIEDRLYDLTEEAITPTSLATTTATQEITSLPSTALKSRLDVTLQGNTYVNLIENGNFANGTTNWSPLPSSSLSATNNTLTITGIGSYTSSTCYQQHNLDLIKQNDKIYIKSYARVTNADCTALSIYFYDGSLSYTTTQELPTQNTWYSLSIIGNITTATPTLFRTYLRHNYVDIATQNGKVMEVQNVMTINLTNLFGAGNEPTLEEADLMFENWFDGVESTGKQIVKSVGKNLFDKNYFNKKRTAINVTTIELDTGIRVSTNSSGTFRYTFFTMKVIPNVQYRISRSLIIQSGAIGNNSARLRVMDESLNQLAVIPKTNTSYVGSTFTSPANGIIRIYLYATFDTSESAVVDFNDIKLELGTTSTTYEEYTETTAIIPAELKQVSDSIRDTFDANLGVYTKNISDWVELYGNNYTWGIRAESYTGFVRIFINTFEPLMDKAKQSLLLKYNNKKITFGTTTTDGDRFVTQAVTPNFLLTIYDADSGWDDTWTDATSFTGMTWTNLIKAYMNGWKLTTANTNVASCVWTGIGSGTTQSGASGYTHVTTTIDTSYTPYRMIYQLATPIVTNYYPNVINAEPSGTVYVYPFVADYDFYDNGCGVSDTTYSINSLEYVNIVDKDTGALSPIDLSTCTVASGGLSFTSTALSASDLVDFGYTYKELSTIPTIEYSYPTNLKATVDGNTNNIRDLDKKQEQTTTALNLKTDEIARDLKILKLMGGL